MGQSAVVRSAPTFRLPTRGHRSDTRSARLVVQDLFGPPARWDFAVQFWDGSTIGPPEGRTPRFTLVIHRPGVLRQALLPPSELALGEAYVRGDIDLVGDLEAATGLGDVVVNRLRSPMVAAHLALRLLLLPGGVEPANGAVRAPHLRARQHSRTRDAAAVRFHYDVGNAFYRLWLDRRMVYSCAYFPTGHESLDDAQTAKLDHICRKLRLRPGQRLLDIGCGWGGLVIFAAQRYGVEATGITLSEPQAALARQRAAEAGVADRVRIDVRDYRELPGGAQFDRIASVGMVEHVGRKNLGTYFHTAHRLLRPGGLFLNHGIVLGSSQPGGGPRAWLSQHLWRQGEFVQRHVFPDGELEAPHEILRGAESAGFETRDVENLREHYALTLRHWLRRLEAEHDRAAALVGEPTYRLWCLYLAGSAHRFATGGIAVIQTLLSKPDGRGESHLPLTRADLYQDPAPRPTAG